MNINVPSFPTCQRLAKAWRCSWSHWAYRPDGTLGWDIGSHWSDSPFVWIPAPTLAEMLAEVARRGWAHALRHETMPATTYWATVNGYNLTHPDPTEALALALAEGLENEGAKT